MMALQKKTVLYFGSFNPIHNGHTSVARYVTENGLYDEFWFVVSPQNPLKPADMLAPDLDRLEMVRLATESEFEGGEVRVCDIEFKLSKPSYMIDTLKALEGEYSHYKFLILGGSDIISDIGRWKSSEELLTDYDFLIYPRDGYEFDASSKRVTFLSDAPRFDYSSSDVRAALERGDDISEMVCGAVEKYIKSKKIWQKQIK